MDPKRGMVGPCEKFKNIYIMMRLLAVPPSKLMIRAKLV
jgi:hypothetical protein